MIDVLSLFTGDFQTTWATKWVKRIFHQYEDAWPEIYSVMKIRLFLIIWLVN